MKMHEFFHKTSQSGWLSYIIDPSRPVAMGRQRGAHYRDKKEETINERKKEKRGKLAKNYFFFKLKKK